MGHSRQDSPRCDDAECGVASWAILFCLIEERGGLTLYEIYIGFCPRTDFFNIMHFACLVHDHFISNIEFQIQQFLLEGV